MVKAQVTSFGDADEKLLNELNQRLNHAKTVVAAVNVKLFTMHLRYDDRQNLENDQADCLRYVSEAKEYISQLRTRQTLVTRFALINTLYWLNFVERSFIERLTRLPKDPADVVYRKAFLDLVESRSELRTAHTQFVERMAQLLDAVDSRLQSSATSTAR